MRKTTALTLALALAVPAAVGAGPGGCGLPRTTFEDPREDSCGLELVSAIKVSPEGGLGQVAVHGDLAAVVRRDDGLVTLLDVSDPASPVELGSYDGGTGDARLDHPLDGDVAFTDDGAVLLYARQTSDWSNEGLHVLDISDPANPVRTDLSPQGGMIRTTYASVGDRELVATLDATHGLVLYDLVRTPLGPKLVTLHVDALPALKVGGPASAGLHLDPADPVLGAPLLYVTDGTTGLRILDLTDPTRPVELGSWDEQGLAAIVVQVGDDGTRTVRAAAEYWFDDQTLPELITLDATDPSNIVETGRLNLEDRDEELAWKIGGLQATAEGLAVAHGHGGMVVIDPDTGVVLRSTTDLGTPNPSETYRFYAWYAMDVTEHNGDLLVADAVTGELRRFRPAA